MDLNTNELIWASGLFEGEGWIGLHRKKTARCSVDMTDEDTLRRFHRAVGNIGVIYGPRPDYGRTRKTTWRWSVSSFEGTQAVIAMLWNGLGKRRKERAREVFQISGMNIPKSSAERMAKARCTNWNINRSKSCVCSQH